MAGRADKPEGGFLFQHGAALLDNGYHVVPIRVGSKAPGFDGWEKSHATRAQLDEWITNGHRWSGVGIITKNTPMIDIDVRDEEVALAMEEWIKENIGMAPVRIGQNPKRGLVFRIETPIRKMRTTERVDEWGDKQQIEILGEGQQFVAYAKHPDTGKFYTWPDEGMNPLQVRVSELPTITLEQCEQILARFEELADEREWEIKRKARRQSGSIDLDNPFIEDSTPVDLSDEEIKSRLLLVPNPEDYDIWTNVGMALYHQWDGDEPGLSLWHEWAETADNYDADALERRWKGFGIGGKKRAPVTVRYIIKMAQEAVRATTIELGLNLRSGFLEARDMVAWEKAREAVRHAEVDMLTRASLAQIAKDSYTTITGAKISLVEIKKSIAFVPQKGEHTPKWAQHWVYDTSEDKFYSTDSKIATSQQGFNAMFDRMALTKKDALDGRTAPSVTAAALALNVYKIPAVQGRRYEPGRDPLFHEIDGFYANTYPENEIPEKPTKVLPRDKRNVQRVKLHITHLLSDPEESRMFLDWLSWIVQNPGKHANYAVLLQGVEGDGKSFFAEMMREVMGVSNVRMLNAHIFESDFTDWMVGQCLACVEEVRIVKAANKYEVINRIKPAITNRIIEIHPKGKAVYNARNTTNYLLFSNYRDALPIDDDGRRYLVLFSQWQRKSDLDVFKEANPAYYEELYATIEQSAGAIREWLLNHEQSDDFNPMGDAPVTAARAYMVRQAKPGFIQELEDLIAEDETPCASEGLVDVTGLSEVFMSKGWEIPVPKTMASMLQRTGYELLGRVRIGDGVSYVWSRVPHKFQYKADNGLIQIDTKAVRNHIKEREERIRETEEL